MRSSDIRIHVELDDNNLIDKLFWEATDKPNAQVSEVKAVALSVWDHMTKETLRIDLWAKDLPVDEMKRLCIDTIGGLADTILTATGDEVMYKEIDGLCERLVMHLREENAKKGIL